VRAPPVMSVTDSRTACQFEPNPVIPLRQDDVIDAVLQKGVLIADMKLAKESCATPGAAQQQFD